MSITIAEQIKKNIEHEHDTGRTIQQIANSYHVRSAFINRLLLGEKKYTEITVYSIQKMFPCALLDFHARKSLVSRCLSNTMDENQEHERRLMDYVRKSCALTSDNISRSALESLILHGDGLTPKERVKFLLFLKEKVH